MRYLCLVLIWVRQSTGDEWESVKKDAADKINQAKDWATKNSDEINADNIKQAIGQQYNDWKAKYCDSQGVCQGDKNTPNPPSQGNPNSGEAMNMPEWKSTLMDIFEEFMNWCEENGIDLNDELQSLLTEVEQAKEGAIQIWEDRLNSALNQVQQLIALQQSGNLGSTGGTTTGNTGVEE